MNEPMALTEVADGTPVTVVEISGGRVLHDRLRSLGIRVGTHLVKVSASLGHGPLVVRHGRAQTALGYSICQKVIVATASPAAEK